MVMKVMKGTSKLAYVHAGLRSATCTVGPARRPSVSFVWFCTGNWWNCDRLWLVLHLGVRLLLLHTPSSRGVIICACVCVCVYMSVNV